jgi:hypothetical protein
MDRTTDNLQKTELLQKKFLEAFERIHSEIFAFGTANNLKTHLDAYRNFAKWLGTEEGQDYLAEVMLSPEVGLIPPLEAPGKKKSANVEKGSAKKSAKRSSAKKTLRYSAQKHGPAAQKTSRKKSKPTRRRKLA